MATIRNLNDLVRHFGADDAAGLNRRLYKDTSCGASISLYLRDGTAIHNGDRERWASVAARDVKGFTIQTIVEGSDATVDSDLFTFPVTARMLDDWIKTMEAEAERLWKDANTDEDDDA